MAYFIALLLSTLAAVYCNDIHDGIATSRDVLILNQVYDYKPSIYTRSETVLVNAGPNEHISRIDVIDKRELKDGIATVSSGGVGKRTAKIDLSGPAVFRGMTFDVKVYSAPDTAYAGEYRQPSPYPNQKTPYQAPDTVSTGEYRPPSPYQKTPYQAPDTVSTGEYRQPSPYQRTPYQTPDAALTGEFRQRNPYQKTPYQEDTQQQYTGDRYVKH